MKKRLCAFLLSIVMLTGMLPAQAWEENEGAVDASSADDSGVYAIAVQEPAQKDGVYQIGTGAELAWFAAQVNSGAGKDYSAVLTTDIDLGGEAWTPIGQAWATRYAGTFDGQGFTVSGLNITASSAGNYGLFGYVEGGTVRNLTVAGTVSVTGSGNSCGAAGVVGQFSGTTGAIENCVNKATVNGSQNVGGVVGYVSGGYSSATKVIQNCANLADITSSSNNAGGVIGYISGQVTVENCYNTGKVSGGGWRAGGITAYMSSSNAVVRNGYTTGTVTGKDSNPAIGKKDSGTVEKVYYLSGNGTDANATAKTEAEMKSAEFVLELGAAFQKDMEAPINGGYPILTFQDATPKYEVSITATPAEAQVTLRNDGGEVIAPVSAMNGTATYRLPDGTYTYSVSAFGYKETQGTVTVSGASVREQVDLAPAGTRTVSFRVTPAEAQAQITVTYDGDGRTVAAEGDGSYRLPSGGYHYLVRARGYAKVEGQLTVDSGESGVQFVDVALQASTQWDGESRDEVTLNSEGVYEIGTGAELAWFAAQVNSGAGKDDPAVLTADIDLGGEAWTPIGNTSSHSYSGVFDGGGYTVSGLKVTDGEVAGLFGCVKGTASKNAELKNIIVQGSVHGKKAGGIAGQADSARIENCGNEADVTGDEIGGIVGRQHSYGGAITVAGCYNTGAITAASRAGGILGYVNDHAEISNCYNTGAITSSSYAGGIRGMGGTFVGEIINSYNTGAITGNGSKAGAIAAGAANVENSYYLTPGTADTNSGSAAKTADELKNLADTLNNGAQPAAWKSVPSMNDGYPVLAWQKEQGGSGGAGIKLNKATGFAWQKDGYGLDTGVATWQAVPNAASYTVILWDYWSKETESGSESGISPIKTVPGIQTTSCDFTRDIEANGPSWYYFTVTPMAAEDSGYVSGDLPVWNDETQSGDVYDHLDMQNDVCYRYTARLDTPKNLAWSGPMARWEFVDEAMGYLVTVYRLEENGDTRYAAGGFVSGQTNTLDCSNYFAVGGKYVFSVTALSEEYLLTGSAEKNSPESKPSHDLLNGGVDHGVYTAQAVPQPDPGEVDRTDWVAVSSARQWMELANVEDLPAADDPQTSQQAVAWSKKYYLTADLDFSGLSAADQARTKSIGTASHRFTGIMDGNGHKITGLTLSNYDSGLFAYIGASGQVYGLTIEGANVQFSDNAAVLALNNYGTIRDCLVVNCNITADTGAVLGGMVSRNYGAVQDCAVQGGTLRSNSVTATGHAGFVGANEGGGRIERCWTSMRVDTQSDYAGGFVGLGYGGVIRNCFALGDVSARGYSGGFAGRSVYQGNTYQNCYAAGTVTVSESGTGHGFIGGNKPDSSFQYDQSEGIENCYYNAASPADSNGAQGKTLAEMQNPAFLIQLAGASGVWLQAEGQNNGLPYLSGTFVPEALPTSPMTVQIALATYDKTGYAFRRLGQTVSVNLQSSGNTRVVDVMDAAADQGLLTYSYETTPTFGRYVHTINGYAVEEPDGWMFTINDDLSGVSASLASVKEGDKILWYEGTTENRFLPPKWDDLGGAQVRWTEIGSVDALLALANSADAGVLSQNYRLTADLDLQGSGFSGIGTAAAPFTGVFDGQGHTVSNGKISGQENVGFFGVIKGATVKNLKLANVEVSGTKNVGGLAGWAQVELDRDNMAGGKANLIGNCHVTGTVSGTERVGGLAGLNGGDSDPDTLFSIFSSIDKCSASAAVSITGSGNQAGGLVGENKGVITKSAALGGVTAPDARMVGGLAGSSNGDIYDSHAEGDVLGAGHVGGFAGTAGGRIRNCYCLGNVSGKDYTGGFSGSLTQADTVMSAGRVTVIQGGSSGYHGGLAGELNGTLTGVDNQITVKKAYANCTTEDGQGISIIGNTTKYQSESQKAVLQSLTLSSQAAAARKLYEMFGVNLPVSGDLRAEVEKYAGAVTARQGAGSAVSLLKAGAVASDGITVRYEVQGPYLTGGETLKLVKANDTAATLTAPVTVTLTEKSSGEICIRKVNVILPAGQAAAQALMDAIAAGYTDSSDGWTVMDMAVYSTLANKTAATSPQALQNALNLLITEAAGSRAAVSDRARIEIVLRAMGIDSAKLYPANSNTPFSNPQKLAGMDLTSGGYYAAPYLLLADLQGSVRLTDSQIDGLIALLEANVGDGLFGYEWEGVAYPDPDTAGAALAALARFCDTNAGAKAVVEKILAALPGAMDETGSFGSANSDAMILLGLLAVGKEPSDLQSAAGASVVDGLLSYVNTQTNRFQFAGADNALATEQGFRALVAMEKAAGQAYNIYDFSANPVQPGRATGSGEVTPPEEPQTEKTITVTFQLKTDSELWIPTTRITVKEGSTVYHVFTAALKKQGDMSAVGAAAGYVRSVTKGDVTLAEFDKGPNSGWLFKVNGELPAVGLTDCAVHSGDSILFYYTSDWTEDPQAGSVVGGSSKADRKAASAVSKLIAEIGTVTGNSGDAIRKAREAYDGLTRQQKALVDNYRLLQEAERQFAALTGALPFEDVRGHWAAEAIGYVYRNGLMNGVGEGAFAPDGALDRAMLVTILYRMEGEPAVGGRHSYADVAPGAWYEKAVLWAAENQIAGGYGNGLFGPGDRITREQLAAMLFRYAAYKKWDTAARADLSKYADADRISPWALEALRWANGAGLMTGRSETVIAPGGEASRGEAAALLMRFCEGLPK